MAKNKKSIEDSNLNTDFQSSELSKSNKIDNHSKSRKRSVKTDTATFIPSEPVITTFEVATKETSTKPSNVNSVTAHKTHIVQRGETIQSIALLYNQPVHKLIQLNGSPRISVGKLIYIS